MKIGIALSGGGVRGAAHIGVLKALHEAGIKIDMISGTSAGAIVAALYAIGHDVLEIERIFMDIARDNRKFRYPLSSFISRFDNELIDVDLVGLSLFLMHTIFNHSKDFSGLLYGNKLENIIRACCEKKGKLKFKDALMPLAIPAVDIHTAETVMFTNVKIDGCCLNDVEIAHAVRASSSFPVVFKPKRIGNRLLVDGGIGDNIPVAILERMGAEFVIAIDLGYDGPAREDIHNIFDISQQAINILTYRLAQYQVSSASYIIAPKILNVSLLDTTKIQYCIEQGYEATRESIKHLKQTLKDKEQKMFTAKVSL
ncbi:MAG: patatin-like phospholipase family protein [Hyphomonadaceae bacterium]|nr:patatin-like phospholipase family protein [Clostridia bacterium]